jgi:hypothetical protein
MFLDRFHALFCDWDHDYNAAEDVVERLTRAGPTSVSAEAAWPQRNESRP